MSPDHRPTRRTPAYAALLLSVPLILSACGEGAHPKGGGDAPPRVGVVAAPTPGELIFSAPVGARAPAQRVTFKNVGEAPLELRSLSVGGPHADAFTLTDAPVLPLTLGPGEGAGAAVTFAPTAVGAQSASLKVGSDAEALSVELYGLGGGGEEGENEPPLQWVADTLGYAVDVGTDALTLGEGKDAIGDEVLTPLFERAGTGPVTLRVVARYGAEEAFPYGFYTLDAAEPVWTEVGRIAASDAQELLPPVASGGAEFDPGALPFGVYGQAGGETQNSLNGLNGEGVRHALRVYPLRDRSGEPVPDSYLIGLEEARNGDYQDAVFVLTNAKPAGAAPAYTQAPWERLFNGRNLDGWYTYLPSQGRNHDPEGVFRVEDGTLHILGVPAGGRREFGYLATEKSYSNYHLRLEYRWGEKRFAPRANDKRDSGVIYHFRGDDRVWPRGVEYQIQEGDTGDFWLIGGTALTTTVETTDVFEPQFEQRGKPYRSRQGDFVRIVKDGTHDNRRGWNTVDIIVRGDAATHMINGRVNNHAYHLFGHGGQGLTEGKIVLQAEGAEVFYRNIQIRPLEAR